MKVAADDEGAGFAYSIGLTKNYHQPEMICFGLNLDVMHWMINELRDRMAAGVQFEPGMRVSGLLEGYDCELRRVAKSRYREFLGYALWFNQGDGFDVFQIV